MKRYLLIPYFSFCFIFSSFAGQSVGQQTLDIVIDPRLELLAVVQFLSGYGERYKLINSYDFPYRHDVSDYFSSYKSHPAVRLFAEMSAAGFTFDAPPAAMLFLTGPPELNLQAPFTDYIKKRAGGGEKLEQFVTTLRDFARETQFTAFFKAHNGTFLQIVAKVKKELEGSDHVSELESYCGLKQRSYNLIPVPLFVGGFGPRLEQADGSCDVYNIFGPRGVKDGWPEFGSAETLKHLIWHEFSHSFINPITEKFRKEILIYSSLYKHISSWMWPQGYGGWEISVNEHIIRAINIRLIFHESGKEAADQVLLSEKRKGFFYIEALCERLEKYERGRNSYPTIRDFYPEFVEVFRELSEKNLGKDFFTIPFTPFTGTINNVIIDKKSVILIVPTNESDKAVEDKIRTYVKKVHDALFKNSPILEDKDALNRDFSNNALVVYGTPQGNLWLAQNLSKLPVRIEPDRIVADTEYLGDGLRFITAWPNPQNSERGVVIYTAQKAEDIIGINSVFHGPTDYVVAKGTEVLQAANYRKQKDHWSFK